MNNKKILLPISNDMEIKRLIIQAMCWEPEVEILFDLIGIRNGWKCVDLGCGPIGVLGPLSRRVGPQGQVLGMDSNPLCIHAANDFIKQNRLKNARVFKGDLYNSALKPHSFDLTHARFVFTQTGCDYQLLDMMIHLTRTGGVILSQESDWTTWNCYPKNSYWEKIRKALIAIFEHDGGDINAGQRTYKMFKDAELADVQIRAAILALPIGHPYRSGMNQIAMSMRGQIIAAQILTENEFNLAFEECNKVINDPGNIIFSYLLCQVWGRVKKMHT